MFTVSVLSSVVDLVLLTLALHYAGGVENPFIFLFVLHLIIESMLYSARIGYALAALVIALMIFLGAAEELGIASHHHLRVFPPIEPYSDWLFVVGVIGACSATCLAAVFLATRIMFTLRERQRELAEAYEDLQRHDCELTEITDQIASLIRREDGRTRPDGCRNHTRGGQPARLDFFPCAIPQAQGLQHNCPGLPQDNCYPH